MASTDVTIRGAGIFGLSVAWACVKRRLRVRVIETNSIGAGASGGVVGALAPHAPETWNPMKQFQLESLLLAEGWWREVQAHGGRDPLYARTGRLQGLQDEAAVALAQQRAEAARDLWQGRAHWQVIAAGATPWQPQAPTGLLIHDTLSARISPRAACAALVAALQAQGAEILVGEAGTAGREEGQVVHATGVAGLAELSASFGRKLGGGVKGQAALLRYDARALAQIYAPGLHIVPHGDGTVAIGSTSESEWQAEGVDDQVQALIAHARAALPALATAPVQEVWAGIRPRAKSRSPVIGPWPGRPGVFIANGGFKTGFGMAPRCAELLAAVIAGDKDEIPAAFQPAALL